MQFELPKEKNSIIKVIGVGGGGSNAVNHMFKQGIKGVDFIVCNTDSQALDISPVPTKIQLGMNLTEGLGAGAIPEVGKNSAIETIEDIRKILMNNTKMVFITAGMGGGTGTGAAPIIASVAKEMGILTVGIVTLPFAHEGKRRRQQAEEGIEQLKKNVDTLLVISNDKLREIYGNLKLTEAFVYADNVLTTAAKSIAEIITVTLHINVDFADIQTVMKDSGAAIMGSAVASGEHRAVEAVEKALTSPLLNDNNITGARYILLNVVSGKDEITMDEYGEIMDYVQNAAGQTAEIIKGYGVDESLGDHVGVTIIATGFNTSSLPALEFQAPTKKVLNLNDSIPNQPVVEDAKVHSLEPELKSNLQAVQAIQEVVESQVNQPVEAAIKNPLEPELKSKLLADELKNAAIQSPVSNQPVAETQPELKQDVFQNETVLHSLEPVLKVQEVADEVKALPIEEVVLASLQPEMNAALSTDDNDSDLLSEVQQVGAFSVEHTPSIQNETSSAFEQQTDMSAEQVIEPIVNEISERQELVAELPAEQHIDVVAEIQQVVAELPAEQHIDVVSEIQEVVAELPAEQHIDVVSEIQEVVSELPAEQHIDVVSEIQEVVAELPSEPIENSMMPQVDMQAASELPKAEENSVVKSIDEFAIQMDAEQRNQPKEDSFIIVKSNDEVTVEFDLPVISAHHTEPEASKSVPEPEAKQTIEMETSMPEPQLISQPVAAAPKSAEKLEQERRALERIAKLKQLSAKLKTPSALAEMEREPAYKRREVKLETPMHSSESEISRFTLSSDDEKTSSIKPNNSFLHDNVD